MIDRLRKGPTSLNAIYMLNEIKKLPKIEVKPRPVKTETESKEKVPEAVAKLEILLRSKRQNRAELSNKFHLCISDNERKRVSQSILALNDEIKDLHDRISLYYNNKQIFEIAKEASKYDIPTDPIELYKRRRSLMTSISRYKKKLTGMLNQNAASDEIQYKEKQLREKKIELSYVNAKIGQYEITQHK
jgi:hypothetical protein